MVTIKDRKKKEDKRISEIENTIKKSKLEDSRLGAKLGVTPSPFQPKDDDDDEEEVKEPAKPTPKTEGENGIYGDMSGSGEREDVTLTDQYGQIVGSVKNGNVVFSKDFKDRKTPFPETRLLKDVREEEREEEQAQKTAEELGALQEQQTAEIEATQALRNMEEQLGTAQRLQLSGALLITDALNFVTGGGGDIPATAEKQFEESQGAGFTNAFKRKLNEAVGRLGDVKIVDFSLNQLGLGDAASKNLNNLQADASEIVKESNKGVAMTLTRSEKRPAATLDVGIENQKTMESAVLQRYTSAMQSLRESPEDIAAGLDITDAMVADLSIIQQNRQMMERYKITRDPAEILTSFGGMNGIIALGNE